MQLEMELTTLKERLDGLRRAKNTTIIRREREEVKISSPWFSRPQTSNHKSGQNQPAPPSSQQSHQEVKRLQSQVCVHVCACMSVCVCVGGGGGGGLYWAWMYISYIFSLQVDHLNSQLLSEKIKYDQLFEEANTKHRAELENNKRLHEEQILNLTTELEQLKREKLQVRNLRVK